MCSWKTVTLRGLVAGQGNRAAGVARMPRGKGARAVAAGAFNSGMAPRFFEGGHTAKGHGFEEGEGNPPLREGRFHSSVASDLSARRSQF